MCGRCVLPNNSLSPNNTLSDHNSTRPSNQEKECGSKAPALTPKPYFPGPEVVPENSLQQHHGAIQYGLPSIFHICMTQHAFLLLKGCVRCVGPMAGSGSGSSSSSSSSRSSSSSSSSIHSQRRTEYQCLTRAGQIRRSGRSVAAPGLFPGSYKRHG